MRSGMNSLGVIEISGNDVPESSSIFEVRDFRNKKFFMADDAFLNGFAREMSRGDILVYLALCRHANASQMSFPGIAYMAKKLDLSEMTIKRSIKGLERRNMIAVIRKTGRHNVYYLLDKKYWTRTSNMGVTGNISVHRTSNVGVTLRKRKDKETNKAPGFQPVLDFYVSKAEEAKGFKPELASKDFSALSKALKKHGQSRVENIILFFLDSDKADKHISLSAALSADTINQYNLKWQKLKFQYSDDAEQPGGEERWWQS